MISPSNIIYDIEKNSVKLIDYGSAECAGRPDGKVRNTVFCGTGDVWQRRMRRKYRCIFGRSAHAYNAYGTLDIQMLKGIDGRVTQIVEDCLKHTGNSRIPSVTVLKSGWRELLKRNSYRKMLS